MKVILSVHEGYSGNVSCALNFISTFLYFDKTIYNVLVARKLRSNKATGKLSYMLYFLMMAVLIMVWKTGSMRGGSAGTLVRVLERQEKA
jgi:uncharacterized membrane protein